MCAVGYSWIPLLKEGRMQSVELQLPVAATLPAGYLCQDTKKVRSCPYLSIPSHVYMDAIIRWGKNCDDCSAGFQNCSPCWVFLVCSSQYPAKVDQRNTRGQPRLTEAWVFHPTHQLAQHPPKMFTQVTTERCQNPVRMVTDALSLTSYVTHNGGCSWYKAMVGPNNESGVLTWPPGPPRFQVPYIQVSDNTFGGQDQGCFHSKIGASIRRGAD